MFNKVIKKVFTISPLLAEMQRRDSVFQKQAEYLKFEYEKHTGPLHSYHFEFNKLGNMKKDIHSDEPNDWISRERAALVTQSHLDVIEYSRQMGYENVCIFENDVLFHRKFHEIFNKAWWKLPDDWDILYLGAFYNYEDSVWIAEDENNPENLFKTVKGSLCSHGYVLSSKALEKFSRDFEKLVLDGKYLIIDQFIGYATEYLGYKTFGILPKLVEQGYCGTPSLTEGLSKDIPDDFDFGEVIVREPHFETNKSSNAEKEDYTFIIHKYSNEQQQELARRAEEAKRKQEEALNKMKKHIYVSDEEYERRMGICADCPFFTDEGRCSKCGCNMAQKTKIASWHCPIKKF